eukprot:CAMPEP_0168824156 /NCGR_PEP_ID=MMETSP0726-20121227/10937_1 /TAXON_ID=265536 /ORGANISM="Amphiprora sp., Strain CCMP467" /LENGTH=352 /DNA_ID=CAMNT_0008877125 /DNA_START=123 /DNA_END=1181 /DNA_ORIENTATION=+
MNSSNGGGSRTPPKNRSNNESNYPGHNRMVGSTRPRRSPRPRKQRVKFQLGDSNRSLNSNGGEGDSHHVFPLHQQRSLRLAPGGPIMSSETGPQHSSHHHQQQQQQQQQHNQPLDDASSISGSYHLGWERDRGFSRGRTTSSGSDHSLPLNELETPFLGDLSDSLLEEMAGGFDGFENESFEYDELNTGDEGFFDSEHAIIWDGSATAVSHRSKTEPIASRPSSSSLLIDNDANNETNNSSPISSTSEDHQQRLESSYHKKNPSSVLATRQGSGSLSSLDSGKLLSKHGQRRLKGQHTTRTKRAAADEPQVNAIVAHLESLQMGSSGSESSEGMEGESVEISSVLSQKVRES